MELTTYGEVYGVRTGTPAAPGTVAIKIGNKVVRFIADDAHLWTPGLQVSVAVVPVEESPLIMTRGDLDD